MFQIRVNNFAMRDSSVGTANSFIITVRSPIRQFPHIDFFYPFVVVTYKYLISLYSAFLLSVILFSSGLSYHRIEHSFCIILK